MASSLVLPSAASLSAQWTVVDKSSSCVVQLTAERFGAANGYKLSISPGCAPTAIPEITEAWRPAPDGIALLNRDGLTVLFFLMKENKRFDAACTKTDFGSQPG
nr:protease inhibitor Inh/omp19 family protein [Erwinia sp. Ejp617]